MPKTFILDTNVLLHDPEAIFRFGDNDIVIPMVVIEELDNLKSSQGSTGRNARHVSRHLDKLREEESLDDGVLLENGGTLRIDLADEDLMDLMPKDFTRNSDNRILATALFFDRYDLSLDCEFALTNECDEEDLLETQIKNVILVSKDMNLRIKANAMGLPAQDYHNDKVDIENLYPGHRDEYCLTTSIDELFASEDKCLKANVPDLYYPNECVTLIDSSDPTHTALTRYDAQTEHLFQVVEITKDNAPMGLIPRNKEQRFAMDLLLDPNIKLITLVGKAGTGKTLMAIAAGLYGATETNEFERVLVSRPVISLGKQDIGFLPGTMEEKMAPWMQPIWDNVEVLVGKADGKRDHKGSLDKESTMMSPAEYLQKAGKLEVGALSFIRGRSIPKQYIIIDEAQNLTPHEVKTIITRAGEGTKIVLTGDPYQIDNPYVDAESNGLTYVTEKFKSFNISAHITLTKGERSELAELAAEVL